ncbi:hypothetical protein F5050DRAFT_1363331 [Lentinula boryana]|uniref:Cupin 2 conserved barrel domain-containing protein n=1 Tax=Lentinula boryana TaxID=40481 RepID=A0ABQ8QGU8_9AGAR|nr:hypothetical protein F5050DRAFT_1363331 [Lentinula boryana]
MLSQSQAEANVQAWGFQNVFTWTDRPNAHYPPHSHATRTTHLILQGEFIITYPKDTNPMKETFGSGSRIDVNADRIHEVWIGEQGCTYVVGE